jgi:hypothetical protein
VFCYGKANFASYLCFPHSERVLVGYVSGSLRFITAETHVINISCNIEMPVSKLVADLFTVFYLLCVRQ